MTTSDLAAFVLENVPRRAALKSAVVEYAATCRGLPVERVDDATLLVTIAGRTLPFVGLNGPDSSFVGKWLCDYKHAQRAIATSQGLPTAQSAVFPSSKPKSAMRFAQNIGWPVVVKPNQLSRGRGVTVGVANENRFAEAWRRALDAFSSGSDRSRRVLVEKQVMDEDFRFFVVDDRVVSATHKVRANVVGDGRSTVAELISQKNVTRKDNPYLRDYPIPDDPDILDALTSDGRTLSEVPARDERVTLRGVSDLRAGGDSVDVTDEVDPYYSEIAVTAVHGMPGLAYAGVDIIASDITKAPDGDASRYVVSDVEFSPAPMAHFPVIGAPRDVAGAIIEHYVKFSRWRSCR